MNWYLVTLLWYLAGIVGSLLIFNNMRRQWRYAFMSEKPIEVLDVAMILIMAVCGPVVLLMGTVVFFHRDPDDD